MTRTMVLLVGEQPIPNLLPARHLRPELALLVHTEETEAVADRLSNLLQPAIACRTCLTDPYDLVAIESRLVAALSPRPPTDELVVNLTGGTKPMSLAGLEAARRLRGRVVYFQTERNQSRLFAYRYERGRIEPDGVEDVPATITLDDYLRLYLGAYTTQPPRNDLEREVAAALRASPAIAEVLTGLSPRGLGALEVDFAVRCGNQVGIGEVKTQAAKAGIDQINAVASREYLGTYVHKFLVSGHPVDPNNKDLARAYRIEIIEVPGFGQTGALGPDDRARLTAAVVRRMSR